MVDATLRLERVGDGWRFAGVDAARFGLVNEYLGYLADRNYSPQTVRVYGFALLAFCRWLVSEDIGLDVVTTDVLLRYLAACRQASVPGRPGPNVVRIDGRRVDGYAPATLNHRLAAISALFGFRAMRDLDASNPVPRGKEARRLSAGERNGLLAHVARRPRHRSVLRLREPQRLPRALERDEVVALMGSLRTWRDRAIAGLMVFCGLRAGEVLALDVRDVDIGGRWLRVSGKGAKERRVPLDVDVAGVIQTYLLAERPETTTTKLFVVAKGPTRGEPLSAAGLRTIFRYHRAAAGVPGGHPHALRHSFGTALAEAGVDLAVMQALLGHAHVDTTARYIHLAPVHVKTEFDAARARQRAR
ncbi:MAG: tyrosine-type recombinase/integrase [Actinomycetota bacterium]